MYEGVIHRGEIDKHTYSPKLPKFYPGLQNVLQGPVSPSLSIVGAKVVMHSIVHDLINNTGRAIKRKVGNILSKKSG